MQQLGFIGPSYTLSSVNVDVQATRNWYPELDEMGTGKNKEVAALVPTPGLRLHQTIGTGPIRANFRASNGRKFCLSGSKVYEYFTDGTAASLLGSVGSTRGTASMADNGVELAIVANGFGYVYTFATATFAAVSNSITAGNVVFQDGYFIVNQVGSRNFFISGLYAGTSWDALDFGAKEGQPDDLIRVLSDHRELWLFGDSSTEVWFNSGDVDFPFSRINGAFIEHGCAAANSAQKIDNTVYWVSRDNNGRGIVMKAVGYQPSRCSTHAIETAIAGYGDISEATSWVHQWKGHSFYALNFPGANTTWFFDTYTNLWHERTYTRADGFGVTRHRAENHIFADDLHLVGDYKNGNIYELTDAVGTDNGAPITRERITPHISQSGNFIYYKGMRLDFNFGIGLDGAVQGSDPKVMMQFSDDGGHHFEDERQGSIGKLGQYRNQCEWRRLGRSRDRVFKIKVTDPVPITLISSFLDAELGNV